MANFYSWEIYPSYRRSSSKTLTLTPGQNYKSDQIFTIKSILDQNGQSDIEEPDLIDGKNDKSEPFHHLFMVELSKIIKILRFFGRLPISTRTLSGHKANFMTMEFFWTSLATFWTILMGILFLASLATYIVHWGFHYEIPEIFDPLIISENSVTNAVTNLITLLFPLESIAQLFISWWTTRNLIKFCNNWNEILQNFESIFEQTFSQSEGQGTVHWHKELTKWTKKMFRLFVLLPTIVHFGFIISFIVKRVLILVLTGQGAFVPILLIINYFLTSTACFLSLAEDYKVILMFKTVQESFKMIRESIEYEIMEFGQFSGQSWIDECKIRNWKKLIFWVRGQSDLLSQYQTPSQLLSCLYTIFILTTLLYAIANFAQDGSLDIRILLSCTVYLIIRFLGIFVKVHEAEKITQEENKLANRLLGMKNSYSDPDAQIEVQMIASMLVGDRTRIIYGNYMEMSKKFLRNALAQSLTYLVVILQFSISATINKKNLEN